MTRPTYEQCLAAGMSTTETARARGVTISAASQWAKRRGVAFVDRRSECSRERMKALHADPEFAKAHSECSRKRMKARQADPAFNPLAALTEEERAEYDTLKRAGNSRPQALEAIGRGDLAK